jgi:hypothetical protein
MCIGERTAASRNAAGKSGYPHATWPLSPILCTKNQVKMEDLKLLEENRADMSRCCYSNDFLDNPQKHRKQKQKANLINGITSN